VLQVAHLLSLFTVTAVKFLVDFPGIKTSSGLKRTDTSSD